MAKQSEQQGKKIAINVSLEQQPDFKGKVAAYVFDVTGRLLERADLEEGKISLSTSEKTLGESRVFIAPVPDNPEEQKPTVKMMERLGAYEPIIRRAGKIVGKILVPGNIIIKWPICFCWVRGRVVKSDSGLPVCGAKVHICEVDRIWLWILKLPDQDIFRLRDDLILSLEKVVPPRPIPGPDPSPFELVKSGLQKLSGVNPLLASTTRTVGLTRSKEASLSPLADTAGVKEIKTSVTELPLHIKAALTSSSAQMVRQTLVDNVQLIFPYLCLWPWWWRFRCDEITTLTTDHFGRFETVIFYSCHGDKPDLYFWVEYEIDGTLETVYRPPLACYTYWNYACGTEVTLKISDDRVPACDPEPDLTGCKVQILSIGRGVSMSELQGPGAGSADEGLTSSGQPFGGRLEPRVWFSRAELRDIKNIKYYRWSYRRLSEGDGTPLASAGPWQPLTRTVVRHYAKKSGSKVTHEPYALGPWTVGTETNLFEIKPAEVPAGGIEWYVVDEREDLASGHFETNLLGTGATPCEKALDAAGKYELKLELFKNSGALVDWTAEGIDLEITNVPAPFGTDPVTAVTAPNYNRIKNAAGHTMAFRMVLRVDNNCCTAEVKPVTGTNINPTACGFIEFSSGATVDLTFKAYHPNNFATFGFSVVRGVTTPVHQASASGRVGNTPVPTADGSYAYQLNASDDYQETFPVKSSTPGVKDLLETCDRAAFSEALHVWAMATDGYGRAGQDAFAHDGFALIPAP